MNLHTTAAQRYRLNYFLIFRVVPMAKTEASSSSILRKTFIRCRARVYLCNLVAGHIRKYLSQGWKRVQRDLHPDQEPPPDAVDEPSRRSSMADIGKFGRKTSSQRRKHHTGQGRSPCRRNPGASG
ncbi:hypothetical protein K438DRAFT_1830797 [Mycena galopus ATCC 62051]|nr:hypothetical protein K438DRAFT_1830797 [Mycena galopus ATCC 62051]